MLKDLCFSGIFRDEHLTVSIMLENPLHYQLDSSVLLFSVIVRSKKGDITDIAPEDFVFYVLDEKGFAYNTQRIPVPPAGLNEAADYPPDLLICTDWKNDFLFQDLRLAFSHRAYQSLPIIELRY